MPASRRESKHRSGVGPPDRRGRPSRAFTIFAIATIAALIFGLLAAVAPAIFAAFDRDDAFVLKPPIDVTPGAEEAEMRARIEENPEDVNAVVILADLLANSGRPTEAIDWYEKAVNLRPDDPALRIAFGRTLLGANFPLDAEIQLKKAAEIAPDDPEPVYLLGELYQHAQPTRLDDARRMYQQVIDMAPESVYAERAKSEIDAIDKGS